MDWPDDSEERDRLILVLQKATTSYFTESDWKELGYETGSSDFISGHRLLQSLHFGDGDYGRCAFEVLEMLAERKPSSLGILLSKERIRKNLKRNAPEIHSKYIDNATPVPDFTPRAPTPKEEVIAALEDAQVLIQSVGPARAIDRVHTALHGYLIFACEENQLVASSGAGVLELYKALREGHLKLADLGVMSNEMNKILRSFGATLDALNQLRNNASPAHPNESLGDDEAMLAINAVRTLLHYLDAKLGV